MGRKRFLGAFLRLCGGIREDQGNEIGQWKGCFDELRLKLRRCYPWLLLGMETESWRGRHTDTDTRDFALLRQGGQEIQLSFLAKGEQN